MRYRVLKFGWTSMGSAQMIQTSANIVKSQLSANIQIWCVVSAMSGVTNQLFAIIEHIKAGDRKKVDEMLDIFREKHFSTLSEIVWDEKVSEIWNEKFSEVFSELTMITEGLTLLQDISDKYKARIVYFGEVFSSLLIAQCFEREALKTAHIYSRTIIATDNNYLNGTVNMEKTRELCQETLHSVSGKAVVVVTGFAGGDDNHNTVLLDRGGSDYVATIVWAGIQADRVEIWTDVNGVYSADPRKVQSPILWEEINYDVAAEMALSGAKVLHPKTISPVQSENIPILIKNTFFPDIVGTKIDNVDQTGAVGINVTTGQTLFHFSDPTMCGAVGFIYHALETFFHAGISIDALTTSEISFTCSLWTQDVTDDLVEACKKIGDLTIYSNLAKISILWKWFSNLHIVSEKIHEHLEGYTVYMISQNASFTNITLFVEERDATEVLQKLHASIFIQ